MKDNASKEFLLELWAQVLSLQEPIGIDDDFFGLGGDSMKMIQMLVRVQQRYAHELDFEPFLEMPTVRVLTKLIAPLAHVAAEETGIG